MDKLYISGSPHVHCGLTVKQIMWNVVIALIPTVLISVYYFGLGALKVLTASVFFCLLFEALIQKFILKDKVRIMDGSALITGILLAFNLPSNLPTWMVAIGALVAIGIAKMAYGGLGKNPFNPALVGRAFLLISFPVAMTTWPQPTPLFSGDSLDALTGPTPFGFIKEGLAQGISMEELMARIPSYAEMMMGSRGGSLGEVSAIAIVLGGLYMLIRRIISWHIPVSFIGSIMLFAGILFWIDPTQYINPWLHLLTGGVMLGAVFMATDMVTSPMTKSGMMIFGACCGILTIIIRVWGAYPEGVSFAILVMNAFVPLINRMCKSRVFGK